MFDKIIKKVGLDRIAHFGVGGAVGAFLAIAFLFSLPMEDGVLRLTWGNIQLPFVLAYVAVGLAALAKERIFDDTLDIWDFAASLLGVVFIHIGGLLGWLLHLGNGRDLITSPWGWAVFGVLFAAAAFLWARWALMSHKQDK